MVWTQHPLLQLTLARLRAFYREPAALFWVYGFPLLLAVGLGIAFWSREPEPPSVDVQQTSDPQVASDLAEQLERSGLPVQIHDEAECREQLRTGKIALYLVPTEQGYTYVYDKVRPESDLARYRVDAAIVRWRAGSVVTWETKADPVVAPGSRYIDFLVPGLMGLNLMGVGLWGVGFIIVDMRVRQLLKRLLATPMRRSHFLLSLIGARLVLMIPDMVVLLLLGGLVFAMPIRGNPLTLALVVLTGATAFAGVGLAVGSRPERTESVTGLMNLIMLPMWLLSGTFFSSKRFPVAAQPFIQALPLTQLNEALREVILEGAGLQRIGWRLAILAAWAVACFVFALRFFRWR